MVMKGELAFPERETERERGRNNCLLIYPLHLGSALNPRTDCWCLSEMSGGRVWSKCSADIAWRRVRIDECDVLRASDSQYEGRGWAIQPFAHICWMSHIFPWRVFFECEPLQDTNSRKLGMNNVIACNFIINKVLQT